MSGYNPFNADTTNISDVEFEHYVASIVKVISAKEGIKCEIKHNYIAKADDGNYQIDILVKHEFLGAENITLIECKKYKSPIPREKIEILYNRIRAIGAHKGMLFSTSRFQEGAIIFAKKHGIALIHLIDGSLRYEVKSLDTLKVKPPIMADISRYSGVMISKTETGLACTHITTKYNNKLIDFITADVEI